MKAILIDIDNTLLSFDEFVKQTMKAGFDEFGLKKYEPWMYDVFKEENDKLWYMIENGKLDYDEFKKIRWNIMFKKLGIDYDGPTFEKYFRMELYDSAIPVDGAFEMLESLHGKYLLAVASNAANEQQLRRLRLAGMDKYFDYVFTSERLGYEKPNKEYFDLALKEINQGRAEKISPDQCMMLGDSLFSDMTGGANAGMVTCYYKRFKDGIISDDVDLVVTDLRDVAKLIAEYERR